MYVRLILGKAGVYPVYNTTRIALMHALNQLKDANKYGHLKKKAKVNIAADS